MRVAVAEQMLGIALAVYIYFDIGGVTAPQVAVQGGINLVFVALSIAFWVNLRSRTSAALA
jgi:hypothetical protein